ncbi:hypothetical protein [Myxococcus hansupus]|uniref:hypothetical protein n=1 Tax=Pseudomyxococcus hansupus TaxID=1297742 RepID=UPI000B2D9907|nr:hypothetical protein [Myxococcus hansupus]
MNLIIVSYPEKPEIHFERILKNIARRPSPNQQRTRVNYERFQSGAERLRFIIRSTPTPSASSRTLLSHLDLVGHGNFGTKFTLGKYPIIEDNIIKQDIREILDGTLREETNENPGTIIRLLGCFTGSELSGHRMIQSVSRALGNREVLGVTTVVRAEDFDTGGLRTSFTHLISSKSSSPKRPVVIPVQTNTDPYKKFLQDGYTFVGFGHPIATTEHEIHMETENPSPPKDDKSKTIIFRYACNNHIITVTSDPSETPWIYQWSKQDPAPPPELNEP